MTVCKRSRNIEAMGAACPNLAMQSQNCMFCQAGATKPGKENSSTEERETCGTVCSCVEGVQLITPRWVGCFTYGEGVCKDV